MAASPFPPSFQKSTLDFRFPSKSTLNFRSQSKSPSTFRSLNLKFCTPPLKGKFCIRMSTAAGPWLMLPPTVDSDGSDLLHNFYSLPENKVVSLNNNTSAAAAPPISLNDQHKIVGSSHGWLALQARDNYGLFLWNPITGRRVKLPPIRHIPWDRITVVKVVISCDDPESEECRAMMIFSTAVTILAFCCPSLSTEWTPFGTGLRLPPPYESIERNYEDVLFSNNLFFCITNYDVLDLECWDVGDLRSLMLHWSNCNDFPDNNYYPWLAQAKKLLLLRTGFVCCTVKYLVAAPDHQLLLVTRHYAEGLGPDGLSLADPDPDVEYLHKTIAFDVHKIDPDEDGGRAKLTHLEGLDGLAIFVGFNHSFAVSASDHHLNPNSIYFTDFRTYGKNYGGHDIGIFDYENRTIAPCYYPIEPQNFIKIEPPPIWFTPTH